MSSDEGTSVDAPVSKLMAKGGLTSKLLSDPGLMQAFGGELQSLIGSKSSYIDTMPETMKRRIRALKNLQVQHSRLEAKYYEEVQALERKYSDLHAPTNEKRRQIITGEYEPTEEETTLDFDEDEEDEDEPMADAGSASKILDCDENGDPIPDPKDVSYDESTKGVPEFWLTVLRNVGVVAPLIEEEDAPLLRHLVDITINHSAEPLGFDLVFHFSENKFISNKTLVKHYDMKIEVEDDAPLSFDGPQITGCRGCEVNWQKGQNLTVKIVKKKQKGKGKGQPGKTITKQVPAQSFFTFFSPPEVPEIDEDEEELDDEQQEAMSTLETDYEIAGTIRDYVIGRAVLIFTGQDDKDDDEGSPFDFDMEDDAPALNN